MLTDACYRGKLKDVIHLLSGDHVDVNEFFKVPKLDVQWTPLTSAAMGGQTTLVKILINKYGARVDNPNTRGMTALTSAAFAGFPDICQVLLENGANIEAPGLRGETALIGAASGGHGTTVDLLMKHGANIEAVDFDGRTPLMKAAKFGCTGTVDLLVTRYGAAFGATDKDGMTAEMIAREAGKEDVAKLIGTLSACPDIFEARKKLDELYKKVEAALELQLEAERKLEEYKRHLCEEETSAMMKRKEQTIMEHIMSEDLLVDYQRRLMEAGAVGEDGKRGRLDPALVKEALESVEKNTRETEAKMLDFVNEVEEIGVKLEKLSDCTKGLAACRKEMETVASWNDWVSKQLVAMGGAGTDTTTSDSMARMMDRMQKLSEMSENVWEMHGLVTDMKGIKKLDFMVAKSEAALQTSLQYVAVSKEVQEALSELMEMYKQVVDGIEPDHGSMRRGDAKEGDIAAAGEDSTSSEATTHASAASATAGAMETAQMLDLLSIKLDGDTYRKGSLASGKDKRFEDGKRAARRSHRNWQLTKDTDSEIAAQHQAAHKIADLLQKSKAERAQIARQKAERETEFNSATLRS